MLGFGGQAAHARVRGARGGNVAVAFAQARESLERVGIFGEVFSPAELGGLLVRAAGLADASGGFVDLADVQQGDVTAAVILEERALVHLEGAVVLAAPRRAIAEQAPDVGFAMMSADVQLDPLGGVVDAVLPQGDVGQQREHEVAVAAVWSVYREAQGAFGVGELVLSDEHLGGKEELEHRCDVVFFAVEADTAEHGAAGLGVAAEAVLRAGQTVEGAHVLAEVAVRGVAVGGGKGFEEAQHLAELAHGDDVLLGKDTGVVDGEPIAVRQGVGAQAQGLADPSFERLAVGFGVIEARLADLVLHERVVMDVGERAGRAMYRFEFPRAQEDVAGFDAAMELGEGEGDLVGEAEPFAAPAGGQVCGKTGDSGPIVTPLQVRGELAQLRRGARQCGILEGLGHGRRGVPGETGSHVR